MSFSRRASIIGKSQTLMGDKDNPIIIDNTEENQPLSGFKVYGMCNQFIDEGTNLIPFDKLIESGSDNGITAINRGDGTYLVEGTWGEGEIANIWFAGNYMITPTEETTLMTIEPNTNYYIKDCVLFGYFSSDNSFTSLGNTSWQNEDFNFIFSSSGEIKITGIRCYNNYYAGLGIVDGYNKNWISPPFGKQVYEIRCPMVAKTNKPLPWSPPTRGILTPSPSRPSPITSAGSGSKQRFNYQTASQDQMYGTNGQLQASSGMTSSALIPVSSNSPYTISYQGENEKITSLIICEFNANQTMTSRLTGSLPYTITTAQDTANVGLTFYNSQTYEAVTIEDVKYIMVNSGESVAPLEDYNESNLKIKIGITNEDETISNELIIPLSERLYGLALNPNENFVPAIFRGYDNFVFKNGLRYYCDYIDYNNGVYKKNLNFVELKNIQEQDVTFVVKEDTNSSYAYIVLTSLGYPGAADISFWYLTIFEYCNKLTIGKVPEIESGTCKNNSFSIHNNTARVFLEKDSTKEDYINFLNSGVCFVYPLSTPVETPIPQEELAAFQALRLYNGKTKISTEDNNVMLSIDVGN